jgi:hypothetical protein
MYVHFKQSWYCSIAISISVKLLLCAALHRIEVTELVIHVFIALNLYFLFKTNIIYVLYIYFVPWNGKMSVPNGLAATKQKL